MGIIREHTAIVTYIASQAALGRPTAAVQQNQFAVLSSKINNTKAITAEDATAMTNAFEQGPWSGQQKSTLATDVATKLSSAPTGSAGRKTQTCLGFERFLTMKRMVVLKSDSSISLKVEELAEASAAIGLRCPSEQTLARMTATVSVLGVGHRLDTAALHSIKCSISDRIKALDKRSPYHLAHTTTYPLSPKDLDEAMYNHAYADDGPIGELGLAITAAIATEASRKFLRVSALGLQTSPFHGNASSGHLPATRGFTMPGQMNDPLSFMAACMHAFATAGGGAGSSDGGRITMLPHADQAAHRQQLTMFRSRSDQAPLQVFDGAAVEPTAAAPPAASESPLAAAPNATAAPPAGPMTDTVHNPILSLVTEMAKASSAKHAAGKVT